MHDVEAREGAREVERARAGVQLLPDGVDPASYMLKRFSEHELLRKPLSEQQQPEILALSKAGDEAIDLSDIPEICSIPPGAVRGKFYSPESRVPVYLDKELENRLLLTP